MKYFVKEAKEKSTYYINAENPKQVYRGFAKEKDRSDAVMKNLSKDFTSIKREKITASSKGDLKSYLQARLRDEGLSKAKSFLEKRPTPTKTEGGVKSGLGGAILGGVVGMGLKSNVGAKASAILKGLGVGAAVGAAAGAPLGVYSSVQKKKRKEHGIAKIESHIQRQKRIQSFSDVKIEKA